MYTEEELLEAVEILIEDFGFDEEEAIDMIVEQYEDELYSNENLLRESYGILEEDGELFIETEMIEYVMDEYDLYTEDAIEVIMEAYEEELYELEESAKRNLAIGGAIAATAGGLAYKAYRDSGARVVRKAKGVEKAGKRVKREQEIRKVMDDVEKSRVRSDYRSVSVPDGNGGTKQISVRNNSYDDAKAVVADREAADKRVLKAKQKYNKKAEKYNKALDHYNKVQNRKRLRKEGR